MYDRIHRKSNNLPSNLEFKRISGPTSTPGLHAPWEGSHFGRGPAKSRKLSKQRHFILKQDALLSIKSLGSGLILTI